jgi:4a-hydroxytetrahydrobiopterin dehydratase
MAMALFEEKCQETEAGQRLLAEAEARPLAREVAAWSPAEKALQRQWKFKDFRQAMAFVNRVADLAEAEGHHPDIFISYKTVRLTLSTHKVGGLSRNDFILAAKIDRLEGSAGS